MMMLLMMRSVDLSIFARVLVLQWATQ